MTTTAVQLRRRGLLQSWILGWVLLYAGCAFGATEKPKLDLSSLERIEVQPQKVELHGPRDQAIMLVTGYFPGGLVVDLTRQAQITSADTSIAELRHAAL